MVKAVVLDAISVKVAELAQQIEDAEKANKSVGRLKRSSHDSGRTIHIPVKVCGSGSDKFNFHFQRSLFNFT